MHKLFRIVYDGYYGISILGPTPGAYWRWRALKTTTICIKATTMHIKPKQGALKQ